MDVLLYPLKYAFLAALIVEALLIGRALVRLAVEKARPAAPPPEVAPAAAAEGE